MSDLQTMARVPIPATTRCAPWRAAAAVFVTWSMAVATALASTLSSLRTSGFDGLNNLLQLPLALPWSVVPVPATTARSHEAQAWVVAAEGVLNGAILALVVGGLLAVRRRRAHGPGHSGS